MFSINLVTLESYQSAPLSELDVTFSDFRGNEIRQVPVIRIFGSTPSGIKTCLHIHGVFPYMYVPCTIDHNIDSFMYKLARAIDSGINVSMGSASSNTQHVYKIQKVSGIPFYGYHEKEHLFFKIYFYNPAMIKRAADLLQNGAILNQSLQPYEAHIPFIMQFMIDYNLYGMSSITLKDVKFRQCIYTESEENLQTESPLHLSDSQKYLPASVIKQSTCKLEVDAQAFEVLNKEEIQNGLDLNPGIAAIWNEEKQRREAKGLLNAESQLLYTNTNDRMYSPTENDIYQEAKLIKRLASLPQISEDITPVTSKTLSYPLEVENEDKSFSASQVLNHFKPSQLSKKNSSELLQHEKPMLKESSSQTEDTETSILDSEDIQLVEILDDLAKENEEEISVDNDSMLGSQFATFSNQIKEDSEDDEIEDLNITSFDLDSLSSWNSAINAASQSIPEIADKETEGSKETNDIFEHNIGDFSSMELPQYDGPIDVSSNNKQLPKFTRDKIRKKKESCNRLKISTRNLFNDKSTISTLLKFRNIQINIDLLESMLMMPRLNLKEILDTKKEFISQSVIFDVKLPRYFKFYPEQNHVSKSKCKKSLHSSRQELSHYRNINLYKLDHQDLDIYDVDEIEHELTLSDYESLNYSVVENSINLVNCDKLNKLNVPSFDGNTVDSSSDSELDSDITINREEKRICIYKPRTKSKNEENVINISLKKRRRELEESNLQSPNKRHHTDAVSLQKKSYHTPTKTKVPQSPRSLSKKYSPLNVKIISPKPDKDIEDNEFCDSKSTYSTPKRNSEQLRMNLLREKLSQVTNIDEMSLHDKPNDSTNTCKKFMDYGEEYSRVSRTNIKTQKEVCKRLNFVNTCVEEIKSVNDSTDECHFGNLSLIEERINDSCENNDSASNSIHYENCICTRKNETINSEINLPSTSKNFVDLHVDRVLNKTPLISEKDVDTEEEDIYNMTYTQYLSKKLESELDTPNVVSLQSTSDITGRKLITITTKFNPPSRQRISNSMQTYGISRSKFIVPFFSNKADLLKERDNSSRNSINNVTHFKCSLNRVTSMKLWRRVKINEFYPSGSSIKSSSIKRVLAGYNTLIIEPLVHPPTSRNIKTWLQAKKYLLQKNKPKQTYDNVGIKKGAKKTDIFNETTTDDQHKLQHSQCSNNSQYSNGSSDSFNPSLRKMLENPLLYKNNDTQQHLGISYGQIEYTLKGHSGNIENENLQNARSLTGHYLTLLSVEVHVITRDKLLPDPEHDSIGAVFYAVCNDTLFLKGGQIEHGAIVVNSSMQSSKMKDIYSASTMCSTSFVSSEKDLLNSLAVLVRHYDPDILVGWEIESLSWGYIFCRASAVGLNNFLWQISRIANVAPTFKAQTFDKDNVGDAKVPGRIILDVWRIMRHEVALLNYTFENAMYNIMRERISCPTFQTLTEWWGNKNVTIQWRVITHYVVRVVGTLRMLVHFDIIGRTCEHARLFGIQFYEVFSRGSQFRVESMMLRLAKPLNYIPISPSIQQRAKMRAPQVLQLIMEPQSVFYTDPLIVLDFQSLYPSIIIAYNYCFSTCLGRVEHIGHYEPYEFGTATLKVRKNTAQKLLGKINFAPCGVAFVKPEVRIGILPRLLTEILNTRLMVKESMKLHGNENHALRRVLHSQQLGLKLIANVTYGYTAANFSGRMPCIEVGDSVVSKGRETLERAIKMVESTPKWGAQVVYGDTDSLFILLRGRSRKEAFEIGAEIADTVTAANPPPVKLKFEKVLQPSILQTKKRYCGYMYESPEQEEPEYLAKGIETVRRDGCPAVAKILEKTLKILFDTKDISLIKLYITRQFDKILRQKISIQDLTFAKEFRGLHGYKTSACVPALELTRRLIRKDPRAIPRTGERVPYVIVAGAPNQPLIHCVRTPMEVISDESLTPNSIYYITKVIIPPLNRCLNLLGIDVNTWYREMTHRQSPDKVISLYTDNRKLTIRQFFSTVTCAACGDKTQKDICTNCVAKPNHTITILHEKIRWLERTHRELVMICQSCTGYLDEPKCESLDCPVLYRLRQARRDLVQIPYLNDIIYDSDTFCEKIKNVQ
ncbi:DNA polymerase zeta catalytic subunit [Anthophora retusa]